MSCSFLDIVGGICGADERTSSSTSVTPLTLCNRDIKNHKKSLTFSGIETEVELIFGEMWMFSEAGEFIGYDYLSGSSCQFMYRLAKDW